jgi:putative hydrolase of the HAD superfamily
MTRRTLVFYDVDGVLIDGYNYNPAYSTFWHTDIDRDLSIKYADISNFFITEWRPVLTGKIDLKRALENYLRPLGYAHDIDVVIDYWMKSDSRVIQENLEQAQQLTARPDTFVYLATNQEHIRARYLWETLGFKSSFARMFYSAALGMTKDNRAFFDHINAELSVDLSQDTVFYFDDTPSCLVSAKEAGWQHTVQVHKPSDFSVFDYVR